MACPFNGDEVSKSSSSRLELIDAARCMVIVLVNLHDVAIVDADYLPIITFINNQINARFILLQITNISFNQATVLRMPVNISRNLKSGS